MPKAIGDFLILDALRNSGGTAVAVTDEELIAATKEIGAAEGVFCAPEGAACLPALRKLIAAGSVKSSDRVVLSILDRESNTWSHSRDCHSGSAITRNGSDRVASDFITRNRLFLVVLGA